MVCSLVFFVAHTAAIAIAASSRSLPPEIPCPRAPKLDYIRLNGAPSMPSLSISAMLVSILESTLTETPTSVDSKRFTNILNSLESTLTKNRGEGAVIVN